MVTGTEKGCILFVDDEELVRLSGCTLLRRMSYEVISASDGFEALELFARDKEKISLAIIDLVMPGMNGNELFIKLKEIKPSLDIVLCSGFYTGDKEEELLSSGAAAILIKPYTSADISMLFEKIEMKKHVLNKLT